MRLRKKQALRIVSLVLAASMALSAFPTAAFAAGTPQKTEAENSAVETQAEDSQDNLATLEFDENGLPIGEGNAEEGWTYNRSMLTILEGYTFNRPDQIVSCYVENNGTISNGVFTSEVYNGDANTNGLITGGEFEWRVTNKGSITGGSFLEEISNSGIIKNININWLSSNSGMIDNVTVKDLSNNSGIIKNSVFGLYYDEGKPENARTLTIRAKLALVNNVIEIKEDSGRTAYVVGDRDVTVKYAREDEDFNGWEAETESDLNWTESADKKTVSFSMPDHDVVLTATEKVYPLVIENGKPVGKGNKTSGWTYDCVTDETTNEIVSDQLTFYNGYTFEQDVEVDCSVWNYGTIAAGVFKQSVCNSWGQDNDESIRGVIKGNAVFEANVDNYGSIMSGVFEGDVDNHSEISGGKFREVDCWNDSKYIKNADIGDLWIAENCANVSIENSVFHLRDTSDEAELVDARVLTLSDDAIINDAIEIYTVEWEPDKRQKVYVTGNRDVTIVYNGDSRGFDGWVADSEVEGWTESTDKKTVSFPMPDYDVTLTVKEKVYPLIIEDGKPIDEGNEESGWTYKSYENEDGSTEKRLTFYKDYVFNTDDVIGCEILNYGTITNGTFNGKVSNFGTITGGTYKNYVYNNYDKESDIKGIIKDGAAFEGNVENMGIIAGGEFNEWLNNNGEITGGKFSRVDNYNTIENADIRALRIYKDSVVEDSVFWLVYWGEDGDMPAPENAHRLNFLTDSALSSETNAIINDVVEVNGRDDVIYVVGNRDITIVSTENLKDFDGWKVEPEIENWVESSDKKTVHFSMPETDVTLTAKEKAQPLVIENGKPVGKGNKWSGWEYEIQEYEDGSISDSLTFYEGYEFSQDVEVDCYVWNYGTITAGTFTENITNDGTIKGGIFNESVSNYGGIIEGNAIFKSSSSVFNYDGGVIRGNAIFEGDVSNEAEIASGMFIGDVSNRQTMYEGKITGGIFAKCLWGDGVDNIYTTLTARGGRIYAEGYDDSSVEILDRAYIVGQQKMIVQHVGADEFGSWESNDIELLVDNMSSDGKTVAFTMPDDKDVTLTVSSERPTITINKDTKLDEDKIYDKDVKNDGIISKGEFTGEVTNNGTIENGTFTDTVTNNGTIKNGKFAGEVKGKGKIEGGTFQQVTEASEISGGVFGAQSDMSNAKVVPSTLKIESSVADSSLVNDVIGNGAAQALALFAENDIATQAADSAEMVAYVVGNQTLTVKYTGTDKSFDKWDTTGLDGAKLSEDGKTITFTMKSGAGDVTLKSVQKKDDTKPTEPTKPEVKTYAVTVKNGKATVDGKSIEKAKKGDVVTITANAAAEGKEFAGWKVIEGGVTLDDESKTTTTFTMGEEAVTVEATYKDKTTAKPTEPTKPTEPDKKDDDGMGALIVGGVIVAGGIATGVVVYNVAMNYIKSALPEGTAIPETREQLAVALWENAGKPEVAVEEGVVLTDTEKAMRWATENKLVSADGADSVSKFDVLVAVYKAKNL